MNRNTKIKRIAVIALAAVFIATAVVYTIYAGGKSNNGKVAAKTEKSADMEYESIFKKDSIIDIKIEIAENDWKSILDNPTAEEYKSANVTVNGMTVKNVGFRAKGNSTLNPVARSDSDRFSFRIKLNEYENGQNLLGLDEFVVNNMYSDPSYMREYLSYEALREIGSDVPKTVFTNLYINGELYGFYLCVEAIDDSFLKRNFVDNDGSLYKQEKGSTLEYVEGGKYDSYELKEGDDETKADLKNFIKVLNEMPVGEKGNIESVLDVDSALRYIAANTVLGSYDSYSGNMGHNYYLYGQDGKFTVIPWDYNMSFEGFGGGGNATTIPIDEPVSGVNIKNLPLINNLLSVEEYKTRYHEYVKELVDYLENFETRVAELANIIKPYIEADPTKFYTMDQFEANIKHSEANANTQIGGQQNPPASKPDTAGSGQNVPQVNPDTTAGASQNTNVNPDNGGQRQRPQGMPEGFQNGNRPVPPQKFENGNMPLPPQEGMRGNMNGGPGGGRNMMGGSIINYVRDRLANIKKQLSGGLPTTGNTTMNNSPMGGGRR